MSASTANIPWYGPRWTRGEPVQQTWYEFVDSTWKQVDAGSSRARTNPTSSSDGLGRFTILSWNIDMMRRLEIPRMKAALSHIQTHTGGKAEPVIVMLNEMVDSDLELMQSIDWIQQDYHMTDISNQNWENSGYGTCVLVPRSIDIKQVFRLHYNDTNMGRDALFVDVNLPQNKTLRIGSTHLESLVASPPKRPAQVAEAARFMHEADASVLGGDLNAIQGFDRTLHSDNRLKDAYLESGGQEGDELGMTWGQMASTWQRSKYGLSRMDKMLFCGGLELGSFETFGLDVEVEDEEDRKTLMRSGLEKGWVTDHLGVKAGFRVAV